MSISRYLVKNTAFRLISFAIGICFTLIVTPIIVRALGQVNFGVWALIGSTIANYLLLDFGIVQAISKFLAAAKVRGDQLEINRICSSGIALNFISCMLSLVVTFVLIIIGQDSLSSEVDPAEAVQSFALFGTLFSVLFIFRTWNGVLASEMHWTLLAIIGMVKNIFASLVIIIWIPEHNGLIFLAVVNGVGFIIEGFAHYFFGKRIFKVQIKYKYVDYEMCVQLLRFGLSTLLVQLGQSMRFRSQPYILVNSIGAQGVAVFSIVTQFIAHFNSLILSAFGVFIPWFSRLQAKGDNEGIRQSMLSALWLSYRVATFIGLCLIFYGPTFVALWLGPKFNDVHLALMPMVLGAIFSTSMLPAEEYLIGSSQHKITAICNISEGIAVVVLSLLFVNRWGMAGVGWVYFASSFIFRLCILPYFVFRRASISCYKFLYLLLSVVIMHVVPQFLLWTFLREYLVIGYWCLLVLVFAHVVLAIVSQFIVFKVEDRFLRFLYS